MASLFNDATLVHHNDFIGLLDGAKAVGDDYARAVFRELVDGVLNQFFRLRIHRLSRLIEDEDIRLIHIGPNETDELPLSHTEHTTPFHDVVIICTGHLFDKF